MPFYGEWEQPNDATRAASLGAGFLTQRDSFQIGEEGALPPPGEWLLLHTTFPFSASSSTASRAFYPGWSRWETIVVVADDSVCVCFPVTPDFDDWPAGAVDVEVDSDDPGTLLTARLRGSLRNAANAGLPTAGVWEIPASALDPGESSGGFIGPSPTTGGSEVFLTSTVDTNPGGLGSWTAQPFDTPWQDIDPDVQRVGWRIGSTQSVHEVDLADGDEFVTDYWGIPASSVDPRWGSTDRRLEYTYRPPRY